MLKPWIFSYAANSERSLFHAKTRNYLGIASPISIGCEHIHNKNQSTNDSTTNQHQALIH